MVFARNASRDIWNEGEDILRELGEHADRLSEVQALAEVTKESRQIMAKSSFAVANAMKGLMKLQ